MRKILIVLFTSEILMLTRRSGGLVMTLTEGCALLNYFTTNHLQQLVTERTYSVGGSKSCIDLVLTDQPNLVINCEIIPSLHTNCHHQINHVTLNIRSPPPPPFSRRLWHYERSQVDRIKKSNFGL